MSAEELNAMIALKIIKSDKTFHCSECGYETATKQVRRLPIGPAR